MDERNDPAEFLSLDALRRIDAQCARFEAACRSGARPDRADFLLRDAGPEEGAELARQLQALDAHYRDHPPPGVGRAKPADPATTSDLTGPAPPPPSNRTRFVLTVTEGPHRGRIFSFEEHDTFIVGRSPCAHCRLPARDEFFSRLHFLVEVNPPAWRLMDMGSTNGTFVNDQRVRVADLRHGDVIRAGMTVLVATVEEEPSGLEPVTREYQAAAEGVVEPAAEPLEAEEIPTPQLGNFQLLRELGRGGMGKVYLALRLSDNSVVALKTILPAVHSAPAVERFLREAAILSQLQHPNIVTFRDMGEAEGQLYFAMDFVPGVDAARLLRAQGPLPIARAVDLTCQLLDALDFAHGRGFVHRDVKPANLMITPAGGRDAVKVVDFGLARVYQSSRLSGLTITGHVGGTRPFVAPEQITRFREARPAADQYATAATLYNLLTGCYVHDFGKSPRDWLPLILQVDPVPIRSRRSDVPEGLAEVIHRALARDPAARFRNVKELQQALEPFRG
jgi:serine/threonine-protein kinase